MIKIKLTDINDETEREYLNKNPEFANQLVATLNQVDAFSPNELAFYADSLYGTYDRGFSPNFKIDKEVFAITNDQICIQSTNRDDLLNLNYYQHLNDLANNYSIKEQRWYYFPQDQVLQLEVLPFYGSSDTYYNIKLTKPIDQYNQNQLNAIGQLMTNVYNLVIKDDELDGDQFADQGKQEFDLDEVRGVGLIFDLNDFPNPRILMQRGDKNCDDHYENNDLKQVLKADSELLKFLNNNNFQADFQPYQSKANKFFKGFLD